MSHRTVIHHFPITPDVIEIVPGLRVVHFGERQGVPTAWVQRSEEDDGSLRLLAIGTGWGISSEWEHVGTVVMSVGLVWHLHHDASREATR